MTMVNYARGRRGVAKEYRNDLIARGHFYPYCMQSKEYWMGAQLHSAGEGECGIRLGDAQKSGCHGTRRSELVNIDAPITTRVFVTGIREVNSKLSILLTSKHHIYACWW